jgi:hypothetical protein
MTIQFFSSNEKEVQLYCFVSLFAFGIDYRLLISFDFFNSAILLMQERK